MKEQEQFEKLLLQFKEKHGRIVTMDIGEDSFVFRLLNRKEYEHIVSWYMSEEAIEEAVCDAAVLYPTRNNWKEMPAGITPALHKEIVYASGFVSAEQVEMYLNRGRALMSRFHEQAATTIAAAFPQYTFEVIDSWPTPKLMEMAARAEWKLNMIDGRKVQLAIAKASEDDEEQEQQAPPTIEEIGQQMREEGLDPIIEIGPAPKPPYVEFPLIAGTKIFKNEELLNLVREHIQRLPGQ